MDNIYRPPGGDPGDHQRTEQFWHSQAAPPGGQGPGLSPGSQDPGYGTSWQPRPGPQAPVARSRRKARVAVGITLAALLAGGGVIAGVSLAGTSPSTTPTASTGTTGTNGGTAAPGSQAALLNAALTAADAPDAAVTTTAASATGTAAVPAAGGPAAGTAPVPGPAARRCVNAVRAARAAGLTGHPLAARRAAGAAVVRCRILRRRIIRFFLLRGIDGQFTFRTAAGTIRTLAYQRGVIESVNSGSSIAVRAADGTTSTWDLVSDTVVREQGGKVSESALAVGEPVWVGGPVVSGAKDARLIFVRPPGG